MPRTLCPRVLPALLTSALAVAGAGCSPTVAGPGREEPAAPAGPADGGAVELAAEEEGWVVDDEPVVVEAKIPEAVRQRLLAATPGSPRGASLRFEGIELPSDEATTVRVFAGRPDATAATSTDDPAYLGSFTVLPAQYRQDRVAMNLDVSGKLSVLAAGDDLRLTLVPVGIDADRRETGRIRFEKVTLVLG